MEYAQTLIENGSISIATALILGFLMAISPCPLATNIAAIGYISKDIGSKRSIFINGVLYALGRAIAYSALGIVLIYLLRRGSETYEIQKTIIEYGELCLAPIMLIIGTATLFIHKINLPNFGPSAGFAQRLKGGALGSFILGLVFAAAFCPSSGFLYFGILIPLSVAESEGYLMPVFFALGTALPIVAFAWILAFSVSRVGKFYNSIRIFELRFRQIVGCVFIFMGIYFAYIYYL